ncbi:MAG: hypothetical protein IJX62_02405, partial [Clostridia bacterium]|nr:hypothetical protein [Clostridia bacterium]
EYFYYYPTCCREKGKSYFRVIRTKDFQSWEDLGEVYHSTPDSRWYQVRWDEMMILEDRELDGRTVYYGYISSEPWAEISDPAPGMLKSYDGIRWTALPPPAVEWGELPAQHMELNFVEKIDGRYYLSMSGRMYLDNYGYSLYTFVGDSPFGVFRPCLEKFRMAGNSRRNVTWLGHALHAGQDLLCALWLSHDVAPEIPSSSFAMSTLKRVLCEKGQLRLGYWQNNDGLFDRSVPLAMNWKSVHPAPAVKSPRDEVEQAMGDSFHISASRDGVLLLSDPLFDRDRGILLEGTVTCLENRSKYMSAHQHAAGVGFYFEERDGEGVLMCAETLGITKSGPFRYADHKLTEYDIYHNTGDILVPWRSGALQGTTIFDFDDTVGGPGHAAYGGVRHGKTHRFKLIARMDYFELYIDDFYVQTYLLPASVSGRIGICAFDGTCDIAVRAYLPVL